MPKPLVPALALLAALAAVPAAAVWDDYAPRPAPGMRTIDTLVRPGDTLLAAPAPDQGNLKDTLPPPAPLAGTSIPRLIFRDQAARNAQEAGFAVRPDRAGIFRLELDTGTAWSVAAPYRAGGDAVVFARLLPGGEVRRDTVALARIRAVHAPHRVGLDWLPIGGLLLLPSVFAGGTLIPFLTGFGFGAGAVAQAPEWNARPAAEYFDHPGRWTATFAATQGVMQRATWNLRDERIEYVPALRLQADAGPRWSAFTLGLGLRIASMTSPMDKEAGHADTGWNGYLPRPDDSVYSLRPRAFALSPTVSVVWAEGPAYALRTRAGGYLSFTPYLRDWGNPEEATAAGTEFGIELDLRPAPHWALRMEGTVFGPAVDYDVRLDPAFGIGLAYALHARPAPSRPSGALASLSAAISPDRFVPGLQLEQDLDPFQSLGLGLAHSRHGRSIPRQAGFPGGSYEEYESEATAMTFTYGLHTDRSKRAHLGFQIMAGVNSERSRRISESTWQDFEGRTIVSRYDSRSMHSEMAFCLMPEAGVRLGAGFGLRLRMHLIEEDPFTADDDIRASFGLTYALPAGAGR